MAQVSLAQVSQNAYDASAHLKNNHQNLLLLAKICFYYDLLLMSFVWE